MPDDKWLDRFGGEWLDGSGMEDEPENAPECFDDYPQEG